MGIQIETWQVILERESPHQDTCSLLHRELYHDSPSYKKVISLFIPKAEYIAAIEASKELLWMKNFLKELSFKQEKYNLHYDNQNAIDLSKNATFHLRTKHIDVRYHWIRDALGNM